MNTSQKTLVESEPFSMGEMAYFQARLKNRLHQLVLREFEKSGLSRAELARRIRKDPPQITRWFNAPGNLRLETLSDLLLGINYVELNDETVSLRRPPRNFDSPDWLEQKVAEPLNPDRDKLPQPPDVNKQQADALDFPRALEVL